MERRWFWDVSLIVRVSRVRSDTFGGLSMLETGIEGRAAGTLSVIDSARAITE